MNLQELIRERYDEMSAGRKKVAAFILNNEADFTYLTSREVARQAQVSEATVVRLAYFLGFERYKDMQEFARNAQIGKLDIIQQFKESATGTAQDKPYMKAVETDIKNIHDTFVNLDEETLDQVVDLLLSARNIGVVGFRGGLAPALLLYHFLGETLENTVLLEPGIGRSYDIIKNWDERDVLFCFEYTATKNHCYTVLKFGKERGCKIVSVIGELPFTIRELSDYVLEVRKSGAIISYTASVVMVNVLLDLIARKAGDRFMKNYEQTAKILKLLDKGFS